MFPTHKVHLYNILEGYGSLANLMAGSNMLKISHTLMSKKLIHIKFYFLNEHKVCKMKSEKTTYVSQGGVIDISVGTL